MKGTMDGAAKNADKVAQHKLPIRPHYLSLSPGRRFPEPEGWWFNGASAPLQYMTNICDADRGVLLTRPAFDIIQEPPQMAAKDVPKGEIKKKLSLLDYRNKKKSASPTERELSAKTEGRANGTVHAKPPPPKEDVKKADERAAADKSHASRPADARPQPNGEKYVQETGGSKRAPRSPDSLGRNKFPQAKPPPEIESRKRAADTDASQSSQKRTKADVPSSKTEQVRPRKAESPGGREGANGKPLKEAKSDTSYPATNGLASSSLERGRENTASPRSTIQVNGSRVRSDSNTSTPRKPETGKASLPVLLSPLHPSLFDAEPEKQGKAKKKTVPAEKVPKPQTSEGPSPTKKVKKVKIPALLSPTLPPIVEEALALRDRKQPPSKQVSNQASDSPSGARKTIVAAPPVLLEEKPARPSLIVTLKLKKATAKRAKELLSLPSKSEKDTLKKERSTSAEAPQPPVARKRPRPADDIVPDSATSKRTKTAATSTTNTDSSLAKTVVRPATPLRPAATAMSRVTSNQSQGQGNTPGMTTGLTPSTGDRPPTRTSEPLDPKKVAQAEACKERHADYQRLGSKLKHARDDLWRNAAAPSSSSSSATLSPQDERRAMALHFEMVLAYMVAFDALNQARALERKLPDIAAWESLLPHLVELRSRARANRALRLLATQMHVLCLEKIVDALPDILEGLSAAGSVTGVIDASMKLSSHVRNKAAIWSQVDALFERVEDSRMKTVVGPWMTVEDGVAAALVIMRRWAEREGVQWTPEVRAREVNGDQNRDRGPDKDRDRIKGRPLNGRA